MRVGRGALVAVVILLALVLQTTVVARLPLPGAEPDLLLVVVLSFALTQGPSAGAVTGFGAGLLADLHSDHEVGRLALAYLLVGYAVGAAQDERSRSVVRPLLLIAAGAAGALTLFLTGGVILDDPRVHLGALSPDWLAALAYDVALAPVLLPIIGGLLRWIDQDPVRHQRTGRCVGGRS